MSLCGLNQRETVSYKIKNIFFFSVTGFQFEHFGPRYKNSAPVAQKRLIQRFFSQELSHYFSNCFYNKFLNLVQALTCKDHKEQKCYS